MINKLIRWGLRIFAFGHMIEVVVALIEQAYYTAGVCFVFGIFDIIASQYVKDCDCDDK
tara:strand:- start:271 stop:447 length:177 start_codon:yes stop_codon:yes gene_type:complete